MNQRLSDEISRKLNRIDRQALPTESIDALGEFHFRHTSFER
jgi:hypothetical protein